MKPKEVAMLALFGLSLVALFCVAAGWDVDTIVRIEQWIGG